MHKYTVGAVSAPALTIEEIEKLIKEFYPNVCTEKKGEDSIMVDLSCFDYESEIEEFCDFLEKHSILSENERYECNLYKIDYLEIF